MRQVWAIAQGTSSHSGTQCEPWIFPCDDNRDYYTKFAGICDAAGAGARFREAELVAAGIASLLGAAAPAAAAIGVPPTLAAGVRSRGQAPLTQWAIGTESVPVQPAVMGAPFRTLVAGASPVDRVAIVGMHTWLGMGDHNAGGWNFFEDLSAPGRIVTMDHCTALSGYFGGQPALPVALVDLGFLLDGVPLGDGSRVEVADRVMAVHRAQVSEIVSYFPVDPAFSWLDDVAANALVDWLMARQQEVADALL